VADFPPLQPHNQLLNIRLLLLLRVGRLFDLYLERSVTIREFFDFFALNVDQLFQFLNIRLPTAIHALVFCLNLSVAIREPLDFFISILDVIFQLPNIRLQIVFLFGRILEVCLERFDTIEELSEVFVSFFEPSMTSTLQLLDLRVSLFDGLVFFADKFVPCHDFPSEISNSALFHALNTWGRLHIERLWDGIVGQSGSSVNLVLFVALLKISPELDLRLEG